jgi:hypothetical protein
MLVAPPLNTCRGGKILPRARHDILERCLCQALARDGGVHGYILAVSPRVKHKISYVAVQWGRGPFGLAPRNFK